MKRILLILALVFVPSQALSTELQIFDYPWTLRAGLHDVEDSGSMPRGFRTASLGYKGFLYDGGWTIFEYLGAHITSVGSINNLGQVVYAGLQSYSWDREFHLLSIPDTASGFNNNGVIFAGNRHDDSIYDGSSHDLFRVPGSVSAADTSIDSHGTIVGKLGKGSLDHGSILSGRSPALGPEPATMLLLGTGLVALAVLSRKLKK